MRSECELATFYSDCLTVKFDEQLCVCGTNMLFTGIAKLCIEIIFYCLRQ